MKIFGTDVEAGLSLPSSAILARGGNPRNIADRQGQVFTVSTGVKKAVDLIGAHHVIVKPSWVKGSAALHDAAVALASLVQAEVLAEDIVLVTGPNPLWGPVVRMSTRGTGFDPQSAELIGRMNEGVFIAS